MGFNGFTVENWKRKVAWLPREDSYAINENSKVIVATDGITRDLKNGGLAQKKVKALPKMWLGYPRPSPAGEASKIVAETIAGIYDPTKGFVKAFEEANGMVRRLNHKLNIGRDALEKRFIDNPHLGISLMDHSYQRESVMETMNATDYLGRDLAGTVASALSIGDGMVQWAYITDCGNALISERGDLKEKEQGESPKPLEEYAKVDERFKTLKGRGELRWDNPHARVGVRSRFRNKPDNPHSYGALTGEDEAMYFLETGTWEYEKGDTALAYTDGGAEALFGEDGDLRPEASEMIRSRNYKGLKSLLKEHVRSEGTLVYAF